MAKRSKPSPTAGGFWTGGGSLTAARNIDAILTRGARLPLRFWRPNFLFKGAGDSDLGRLTAGRFPVTTHPGKTHPLFALRPVAEGAGFAVCPCSSKKPHGQRRGRWIPRGCRLEFSGYETDRDSYLVEGVAFNIPASMALAVRFLGAVPPECLRER
jgi:hypothetical protein